MKDQVYPMRRKGVVVPSTGTVVPLPIEPSAVGSKPEPTPKPKAPVPNYICYPEAFRGRVDERGNWLGGKLPKCRKCDGLLDPKENHVCPGYYPKYPGIRSDIPFEERKAMREYMRETEGEWDDDQYDRTTPGEIMRNPDEEDSGVILEFMDEDSWIAAKRRRMGLAPGYDPPDFEPEED